MSVGYEPDRPIIRDLSFTITGPERIAVTGPNGSGKTTFLALVAGQLQPWTGTVRVSADFAILDQHVNLLDPTVSIRENFLRINPPANENACRAALARFMFRADAALQIVSSLSGGELLRAGLACVLGGVTPPSLLLLDEPTNHLDIDSIEMIEAGLRAYDGALPVVSHDVRSWPPLTDWATAPANVCTWENSGHCCRINRTRSQKVKHTPPSTWASRHRCFAASYRLNSLEPLELRVPKVEWLVVAGPVVRDTERF